MPGVIVHGRVDRIDRLPDGGLAIIDYKTGKPPSKKAIEAGFALQLGLLGLIGRAGGFEGVEGDPEAVRILVAASATAATSANACAPTRIWSQGEFLDPCRTHSRRPRAIG